MNYLQMKKKAMLNYVSGITPTKTVQIVSHSTGGSPSVDVTYNGTTETITYSQLYNKTPKKYYEILVLDYRVIGTGSWEITLLGDIKINGTQYYTGDKIHWTNATSVDYECVGTTNTTDDLVYVTLGGGSTALGVLSGGEWTEENYNYYFNKTISYNLVDITYNTTDRWKIIANTPLMYNGVAYQVGDVVDRINYTGDYDVRLCEPI